MKSNSLGLKHPLTLNLDSKLKEILEMMRFNSYQSFISLKNMGKKFGKIDNLNSSTPDEREISFSNLKNEQIGDIQCDLATSMNINQKENF